MLFGESNELRLNIYIPYAERKLIDTQMVSCHLSLLDTTLSATGGHTILHNLKRGTQAIWPIIAVLHSQVDFFAVVGNNIPLDVLLNNLTLFVWPNVCVRVCMRAFMCIT